MSALYGVCTQQAHVAGAGYREFSDRDEAFGYAGLKVFELGGSERMTPFVESQERPDTWIAEDRDWVVTVKCWR